MKNLTAITCVFSNPQFARTTPRGLELIYLKELLEDSGREVMIFGKKCRTNKDLSFFQDIVDIRSYKPKALIIQLAPANFFGGKYSDYSVEAVKEIAELWRSKEVRFNILPTDPRIKPLNPAKVFSDRFEILSEYIEVWDEIIAESIYLFPGKDINKFFGTTMNVKVFKLDWFAYIFKAGVAFSKFVEDKKYDVIYYGDKRGSHRAKRIKALMPFSTSNLLLGYKDPKITYATFEKKVKHSELFDVLDQCKVSLVIGDKEHEDNVATFRFYEALASSSLAAIDINFDPNKELIKNEILRDILYVSNMNDVKKLSNLYSEELINLQQQELKRIFNEINC